MYRRTTRENSPTTSASSGSALSSTSSAISNISNTLNTLSDMSNTASNMTASVAVSGKSYVDHQHAVDDEELLAFESSSTSSPACSLPTLLPYSFVFISFGYMLPWTALGSLISYFKFTYSAQFFVHLYCAFYLPGLFVAVLQYW